MSDRKARRRQTYRARLVHERGEKGWGIKVVGVPGANSQARSLARARDAARVVAALCLEVDPDSFDLEYVVELPSDVRALVDDVEEAKNAAAAANAAAGQAAAGAALGLQAAGVTVRDAGEILGLSFQRVSQLVAAANETRRDHVNAVRSA